MAISPENYIKEILICRIFSYLSETSRQRGDKFSWLYIWILHVEIDTPPLLDLLIFMAQNITDAYKILLIKKVETSLKFKAVCVKS